MKIALIFSLALLSCGKSAHVDEQEPARPSVPTVIPEQEPVQYPKQEEPIQEPIQEPEDQIQIQKKVKK